MPCFRRSTYLYQSRLTRMFIIFMYLSNNHLMNSNRYEGSVSRCLVEFQLKQEHFADTLELITLGICVYYF